MTIHLGQEADAGAGSLVTPIHATSTFVPVRFLQNACGATAYLRLLAYAARPPAEDRRKLGLSDRLIRLSVGIEALEDLLEDLAEGLAASPAPGAAAAVYPPAAV